jgi:hypothetical protein
MSAQSLAAVLVRSRRFLSLHSAWSPAKFQAIYQAIPSSIATALKCSASTPRTHCRKKHATAHSHLSPEVFACSCIPHFDS